MESAKIVTIEDFWRIDDLIKAKWAKKFYRYIDYCGLEPIRPMKNYGYDCTPKNSLTFAATGGNGVHFGFLVDPGKSEMAGPVIVTVPVVNKNIVVAEDFEEFLSLGINDGWFALEELVYDLEDTLKYYSQPDQDPNMEKEEHLFLEMLRNELDVKHKPLTKERLTELQKLYFDKIELVEDQ